MLYGAMLSELLLAYDEPLLAYDEPLLAYDEPSLVLRTLHVYARFSQSRKVFHVSLSLHYHLSCINSGLKMAINYFWTRARKGSRTAQYSSNESVSRRER
ncbi:uncharacterized protein FPRO_11409 [Fusarium proliferatum ET1]|uniref:Uncharacterized protein n=1 Tax=Fusarium proliferatum (strain ET1) TaxID=1227346 RepID=A0A1L7W0M4_FUSPR|nr:uncharacterized protein FPRO_11409 [Fusarium proliferatum ET1]CZR45962.1 uncharacterized protein FPRO_11409 [Fusarium proliferatum ET1]